MFGGIDSKSLFGDDGEETNAAPTRAKPEPQRVRLYCVKHEVCACLCTVHIMGLMCVWHTVPVQYTHYGCVYVACVHTLGVYMYLYMYCTSTCRCTVHVHLHDVLYIYMYCTCTCIKINAIFLPGKPMYAHTIHIHVFCFCYN